MATARRTPQGRLIRQDQPASGLDGTRSSAVFSECRRYRYSLAREWGDGSTALFICLNPSTADQIVDDPTVRRCVGFARAWGCGRLVLANLFAFRSVDPSVLPAVSDPIGPMNDEVIAALVPEAGIVIAAWGITGRMQNRDRAVLAALPEVHCLGRNKGGTPKHPLYLRADTVPVLYPR